MGPVDTTPALRDTPKGRFATFLYRSSYLVNILHMERSDLNNGRNCSQKGQIASFWHKSCGSCPHCGPESTLNTLKIHKIYALTNKISPL